MRTRSRSWLALLAVIALTSACSDTSGPEAAADAGGTWKGSLTHPSYDGGALTLTMVDINSAVSGTYQLILSRRVGGRVAVEQSGGQLTGSSTSGRMRLLLQRTGGEQWLLDGALGRSRAQGEWTNSRGTGGDFDVTR